MDSYFVGSLHIPKVVVGNNQEKKSSSATRIDENLFLFSLVCSLAFLDRGHMLVLPHSHAGLDKMGKWPYLHLLFDLCIVFLKMLY